MHAHNLGFYKEMTKKYFSIIIKYHQIGTLSDLIHMLADPFQSVVVTYTKLSRSMRKPTRNWLQARLTVYPPQCAAV